MTTTTQLLLLLLEELNILVSKLCAPRYERVHRHAQKQTVLNRLQTFRFPYPLTSVSGHFFVDSDLFALFRSRNILQCYVYFPYFSSFPPPWGSLFPASLFKLSLHFMQPCFPTPQ